MWITCQPNCDCTGSEMSPTSIARTACWSAGSANCDTGVDPSDPPFWATLGSFETSFARVEEIGARCTLGGHLRVDVLGLRLRRHEDVVDLDDHVIGQRRLVLGAQIGLAHGALHNRRAHGLLQHRGAQDRQEVVVRHAVGLELGLEGAVAEVRREAVGRVVELRVGDGDIVRIRVPLRHVEADQLADGEPVARRLLRVPLPETCPHGACASVETAVKTLAVVATRSSAMAVPSTLAAAAAPNTRRAPAGRWPRCSGGRGFA